MEFETMLLYFSLYKAFEVIFYNIGLKAATQPIRTKLVEKVFNKLSGIDKEKLKVYFEKSCSVAADLTIENYTGEKNARAKKVLNSFNNNIDNRQVLEQLGTDLNSVLISDESISPEEIAEAYSKAIKFDHYITQRESLEKDFVIEVLAVFLGKLRHVLEYPTNDLVTRLMVKDLHDDLRDQRRQSEKPVNTEEEYKTQINRILGEIGFEGIASSGIRYPIPLTKIYVDLNAKPLQLKKASWSDEEGTISQLPIEELGLSTKVFNSLKRQGITTVQEIIDISYTGGLEALKSMPGLEQSGAQKLLSVLEKQNFVPSSFPGSKSKKCVDLLGSGESILLLGDPGSGKTTFLKYCAVETALGNAETNLGMPKNQKGAWFPIYIELREFSKEITERNEDYNLLDFINTFIYEQFEIRLPDNHVHKALKDKRCIVCFDGLDEVWNVGNRRKINNAVLSFTNKYKDNTFLITSRFRGYETAPINPDLYVHYEIAPFGPDEINHFVSQWYQLQNLDKKTEGKRIKDLLGAFADNNKIKALARNPLLLTIIALVHKAEAELPDQRHKLYEKCVETLLDTWDKPKEIPAEEKKRVFYQERRPILEKLAHALHTSPKQELERASIKGADLEQKITEYLIDHPRYEYKDTPAAARDEAKAFIDYMPKRTGLLLERGTDEYSFSHLTFQEYLTAIHIQNSTYSGGIEAVWEKIDLRLHKPHWEEVLLLLLGLIGDLNQGRDSTYLVNKILDKGNNDQLEPVLHHHLFFAGRILGDGVIVSAQLSRQIITELFNILRSSPNCASKDAANVLNQLDDFPTVVQTLLDFARNKDQDSDVRSMAVYALGELDSPGDQVIQALLDLVQDMDQDNGVRSGAVVALGKMDSPDDKVIQILLALAQDEDLVDYVRAEALRMLGRLDPQSDQVIQSLIDLAQDMTLNKNFRSLAITALRGHPSDQVIQTLFDLAKTKTNNLDGSVRTSAVAILGELAEMDSLGTQSIQALLNLATDKDLELTMRTMAVSVLGGLGSPGDRVIQTLLGLAKDKDLYVDVRSWAVRALRTLDSPSGLVIQTLLDIAQDKDNGGYIRSQAVVALGEMTSPGYQVIQTLLDIAQEKDQDEDLHSFAVIVLAKLGSPGVQEIKTLLDITQDKDQDTDVRWYAINSLVELDSPGIQVSHALFAIAQETDMYDNIRDQAVVALGRLTPSDHVIQILHALAQDEDLVDHVRAKAVSTLRRLDSQSNQVTETLLALTQVEDQPWQVRIAAVDALGSLDSPGDQVVETLLALAQDKDQDWSMHRQAYYSLKMLTKKN